MAHKSRELREFVERALVDEGVARPYEFTVANNSHQQVVFHVKGIRVKYQFAFSPSDFRGMQNSRAGIRRAVRTAAGRALSGAPTQRSLLDAGGLLPGEPDHLGGRGAGFSKLAPSVRSRWKSGSCQTG